MSGESSSVEDPGGVDDDPGVDHEPGDDPSAGHEPGVDPDVGDPLVLLLAGPVQRELVQGAGNPGEGHLGGGQSHVECEFLNLGFVGLLAEIVVLLDVFFIEIVAGIIAPVSICWLGSGLSFFVHVGGSFYLLRIVCSLWHFVSHFRQNELFVFWKFLVRIIEIFKRIFVGITCSLWHFVGVVEIFKRTFDGSAEIFAIFEFCLITARAGHILFVLPLFKLVQQQDGVSWWQRSSEHVLNVPDNVTPEAAEPVVLARAAAAEVAAVRPAPQVSLRHLAGCDGRRPSSCFDSLQRHN